MLSAGRDGLLPHDVQAELEKILSSEAFLAAPQLSRFLRYVVEQELAGRGDELKEYTLGTQVFRKPESFDARVDNVVRTEARRLRKKLADYYKSEGANDPIEIGLPKGSYRATFLERTKEVPPELVESKSFRFPRAWAAMAALTATAATATVWITLRPAGQNRPVHLPAIAVLPLENLSADPEQEYFSEGMTDALITDLAKISGLRVISRTSILRFKAPRRR